MVVNNINENIEMGKKKKQGKKIDVEKKTPSLNLMNNLFLTI